MSLAPRFAACGALFLLTPVATAGVVGISTEIVATNQSIDGRLLGTVRIYAHLDDPLDTVHLIQPAFVSLLLPGGGIADVVIPIDVSTTDPQGFYQHSLGANTSAGIDASLFAANPELAYDSWMTIDATDSAANPLLEVNMDWFDFENNGFLYDLNGAIFLPAGNPGIQAGADGRVLLAQLTAGMGESVSGYLTWRGTLGGVFLYEARRNFTVELCESPATDLGYGNEGSNLFWSRFQACGDLGPGGQATLQLRRAPANSPGVLVFSLGANPTPLFGSTLVPASPLLPVYLTATTNALGEVDIPIGNFTSPLDLYAQWLVFDASVQGSFAFSNALVLHLGQ